ncbi:MAG: AMP-binding protein, partial [Candidatus Aminicenantes bacterium]|nr:AMP-binding protein [Candidatus Aminicenantes bacterium]NIQ73534.1 AMP-binding protein [Candidatus Aminicenantes bacterium]NIT29623.1 AMP-binding protein [Candidatus Aminicenantes bacterium]
HVTFKEVTRREIDQNIGNIGRPIPTLTTYILDNHYQPVPIGVTGELWVGGAGVARGYLNRPALTAERIIENPHKPGERLYRSGDLARFLEDGELVYLGRKDLQVQLRGFRIELGEIEHHLLNSQFVKEVVVIMREDDAGDKYLCAYIVPPTANAFDSSPGMSEALKNHLLRVIPDYMVPSFFVFLDKIPLTPNGKVDYQALPAPAVKGGKDYTAPRDKIEESLVKIWTQLLN